MNIQTDNSYNVSMQRKGPFNNRPKNGVLKRLRNKIEQKLIDIIPEKTFTAEGNKLERYEKVDGLISRPDVNRLIMGATAITTQPVIDYYNHRVDDETRVVSRNRTISKIVAGTTVGILVRGLCYRLVTKMTDISSTKKYSRSLLPKGEWQEIFKRVPKWLGNYKSALATGLALAVMLITNFALDAPLTVYFTNKLNAKSPQLNKKKEVANG